MSKNIQFRHPKVEIAINENLLINHLHNKMVSKYPLYDEKQFV